MPITISPSFSQITYNYNWASWKAALAKKGGIHQYNGDDGNTYLIYFYNGQEVHIVNIFQGTVPESELLQYSQEQNDVDKADFEANYKSTANKSLDVVTIDFRQRVTCEKSNLLKMNFFTHDWTDKTSWYTSSVEIIDEVAIDSGDHITYSIAHAPIVDTYHGKNLGEDFFVDVNNHCYRVAVKIDDVLKTEVDPHTNEGDYSVNYEHGTLTFGVVQAPDAVVKVTYHSVTDSTFIIQPSTGTKISIAFAEFQLTTDVEITDTFKCQVYGYVDVYAPQLMPGIPAGTKIPLGNANVYKGIRDFNVEATKSYPIYPAIGGSSWRGLTKDMIVFNCDYVSTSVLYFDHGNEMRIKLEHDVPFNGTYASHSFICTVENL